MLVNLIVADRLGAARRVRPGPKTRSSSATAASSSPYAGRVRVVRRGLLRDRHGQRRRVGVAELDPLLATRRTFGDEGSAVPQATSASTSSGCRSCSSSRGWTFAALLVVLIVTAVFHYLNGGIRLQTPFQRVTPQVKVHLSVILALMALTKTVQYYLARFELDALAPRHRRRRHLHRREGAAPGAQPADVISVAAAVLFIVNIWRAGLGASRSSRSGLWGFISIVVGTIYPAVIQRFAVQPNEFAREQPYIKRNIEATRAAFGLDNIQSKTFDYYEPNLSRAATSPTTRRRSTTCGSGIRRRSATRSQADPGVPAATSSSPTSTSTATTSNGAARPDAHGRARARPGSSRATRGRTSTSCTRTARRRHRGRRTRYNRRLSPTTSLRHPADGRARAHPARRLLRRGISAATRSSTPRCRSRRRTASTSTTTTQYKGNGGVKVSSFAAQGSRSRCGSATGTSSYSGQVTSESRGSSTSATSSERVETAAPFLQLDADPYPVVLNGRSCGCSTGTRRPTAIRTRSRSTRSVPAGSGLDSDFNYVRNSVKATVDAYDGTVHFYVVDPQGPDHPARTRRRSPTCSTT